MSAAVSFGLALLGLLGLALAMERHRHVLAVAGRSRALWRCAGILGLAGSLCAAAAGDGWAIGTTLWLTSLGPAILAVALLLAGRRGRTTAPKRLAEISPGLERQ